MKNINGVKGWFLASILLATMMSVITVPANAAATGSDSLRQNNPLMVTQTARGEYTRITRWSISTSAQPAEWSLFYQDEGVSRYTVDLKKIAQTEMNWTVKGNVRITNTNRVRAIVTGITVDVGHPSHRAAISCPSRLPVALPAGQVLDCTYTAKLSRAMDGMSRVTVKTRGAVKGANASTSYAFDAPTREVNAAVQVSANGQTYGPYTDSVSFSFDKTYSCQDAGTTQEERATIVETGQTSQASVQISCPLTPGLGYASSYQVNQDGGGYGVTGTLDIHQETTADMWISSVKMLVASTGTDTDGTVDCGYDFAGGSYRLRPGEVLHCTFQVPAINPTGSSLYGRINVESSRWLPDGSRQPASLSEFTLDPVSLVSN